MRFLGAIMMTVLLGGCAQGRNGLGNQDGPQELWAPQSLCTNTEGVQTLACVDIQLNITANSAYIDVVQLGFDPASAPYRIFARRANESTFNMLADNVTAPAGSSIEVPAIRSHFIEEYEEWIIEVSKVVDDNGFENAALPLQGTIGARAIIYWPELDSTTTPY